MTTTRDSWTPEQRQRRDLLAYYGGDVAEAQTAWTTYLAQTDDQITDPAEAMHERAGVGVPQGLMDDD